jgi:hypothetical protein
MADSKKTKDKQKDSPTADLPVGPPGAWGVLQAAIKAVPEVKWALGVAGVAAAAAIARALSGGSTRNLVISVGVMLVLMVLLLLVATLVAKRKTKGIRIDIPIYIFLYFIVVLVVSGGSLSFTSFFFNWPLAWAENKPPANGPGPNIRIQVRDDQDQAVSGVRVFVRDESGRPVQRTSDQDGIALFEDVPQLVGKSVTIAVDKEDYRPKDPESLKKATLTDKGMTIVLVHTPRPAPPDARPIDARPDAKPEGPARVFCVFKENVHFLEHPPRRATCKSPCEEKTGDNEYNEARNAGCERICVCP